MGRPLARGGSSVRWNQFVDRLVTYVLIITAVEFRDLESLVLTFQVHIVDADTDADDVDDHCQKHRRSIAAALF